MWSIGFCPHCLRPCLLPADYSESKFPEQPEKSLGANLSNVALGTIKTLQFTVLFTITDAITETTPLTKAREDRKNAVKTVLADRNFSTELM